MQKQIWEDHFHHNLMGDGMLTLTVGGRMCTCYSILYKRWYV